MTADPAATVRRPLLVSKRWVQTALLVFPCGFFVVGLRNHEPLDVLVLGSLLAVTALVGRRLVPALRPRLVAAAAR